MQHLNEELLLIGSLQNGVRGLMLDMYDFNNDIWLCHSFGGRCYNYTAFVSVLWVVISHMDIIDYRSRKESVQLFSNHLISILSNYFELGKCYCDSFLVHFKHVGCQSRDTE